MFNFKKLEVYQLARGLNREVLRFLFSRSGLDPFIRDQWKRSTISMLLNLSEGTGRVTEADKKHFFTVARGSLFEAVSLLQLSKDLGELGETEYNKFYLQYEQISRMLLGLYRSKKV